MAPLRRGCQVVPRCSRTGDVVETRVCPQWLVQSDGMAQVRRRVRQRQTTSWLTAALAGGTVLVGSLRSGPCTPCNTARSASFRASLSGSGAWRAGRGPPWAAGLTTTPVPAPPRAAGPSGWRTRRTGASRGSFGGATACRRTRCLAWRTRPRPTASAGSSAGTSARRWPAPRTAPRSSAPRPPPLPLSPSPRTRTCLTRGSRRVRHFAALVEPR